MSNEVESLLKKLLPLYREGEQDKYNKGWNDCLSVIMEKIKQMEKEEDE